VKKGVVFAAIAALVFFSPQLQKLVVSSPKPAVIATVTVDGEFTAGAKAAASLISGEDAKAAGQLYAAQATVIKADVSGEYVKTTGDVYRINSRSGMLTLKSRLQDASGASKYPGFADAVDKCYESALGTKQDVPLTQPQRDRLVRMLDTLSAALQ
jgi:hypothetical protein